MPKTNVTMIATIAKAAIGIKKIPMIALPMVIP